MVLRGHCQPDSDALSNGTTYFILHTKLTLTLCRTAELTRVAEHVVKSDFCSAHKLFITDLTVNDSTSPLVQSTDDST